MPEEKKRGILRFNAFFLIKIQIDMHSIVSKSDRLYPILVEKSAEIVYRIRSII